MESTHSSTTCMSLTMSALKVLPLSSVHELTCFTYLETAPAPFVITYKSNILSMLLNRSYRHGFMRPTDAILTLLPLVRSRIDAVTKQTYI